MFIYHFTKTYTNCLVCAHLVKQFYKKHYAKYLIKGKKKKQKKNHLASVFRSSFFIQKKLNLNKDKHKKNWL